VADDLELSEHAALSRSQWNEDAPNWVESGRANWARDSPAWGTWRVPDDELRILPDVRGMDAVDLGCGTAYWSAWLARLGARPIGVDVSEAQLETARTFQREHGVEFPLLHTSAESVPLADESFDLAFSEYGAAIWCDPYVWIPEARRLLRHDGWLVFLCHSTLSMVCSPASEDPAGETLVRPMFGLHRLEWPGDPAPDFHLPHGQMIQLLRRSGFAVEALHELRAPEGPADEVRHYLRRGWCRQWPGEEVWVARAVNPGEGAR
jgi:SAM-dependent methyltransferase